jgi:hypothetical protein
LHSWKKLNYLLRNCALKLKILKIADKSSQVIIIMIDFLATERDESMKNSRLMATAESQGEGPCPPHTICSSQGDKNVSNLNSFCKVSHGPSAYFFFMVDHQSIPAQTGDFSY